MKGDRALRVAVLVSGGGTNLQALLDRQAAGTLAAEIVVVAADRSDAFGLVRAERAGVPAHVVDYAHYLKSPFDELPPLPSGVDLEALDARQRILETTDRARRLERLKRLVLAEEALINALEEYRPDVVCLAGFMRLVSPHFIKHFNREGRRRILNIHPALLPAFPGQHGYEDTFAYGCKWGGITVHFVDEGEDTGPIIAQAVYPLWPGDSVDDVRRRGLELEYLVYAQCLNWLAAGEIRLEKDEEPSGRLRAMITDPRYRTILEEWAAKAFS